MPVDLTPYVIPATIQAIFRHHVAKRNEDGHRAHLGGSVIGIECKRSLFYIFRWAWAERFDGRMLRLFESGHREEARMITELRAIGITVWDRDPDDPAEQISFTAFGGHFKLSLDGIGEGFSESRQAHVLEFKTCNSKAFKTLKEGVKFAKPVHYAQMQIGMHLSKLDRAYYFASDKNTDQIHGERIRIDHSFAKQLLSKAETVIFATTPPAKLSDDPSFFKCKYCPHYAICHGSNIPEVSCRTCSHATPERDGSWSCAKHNKTLTLDDQRAACIDHLFIPQMMHGSIVDAGDDFVEYDNGMRNHRNSHELSQGCR